MTNKAYILKMPKVLVCVNSKSPQYKREFSNEFCANLMGDLFCILCYQTVNCEKCFRVESHQSSAKHKKLLSMTVNTAEKWQQTIPILKKNFKSKLVEAFLAADIPCFSIHRSTSSSPTLGRQYHLKAPAVSMWTS